MCRRIVCETCQKPTYSGCGRHVEEVLIAVPRDARCRCRESAGRAQATNRAAESSYAAQV